MFTEVIITNILKMKIVTIAGKPIKFQVTKAKGGLQTN